MKIDPDQLSQIGDTIWYESKDFGIMNTVEIPSADTLTWRNDRRKGKPWGRPRNPEIDERPDTDGVLNIDQIEKDLETYHDQEAVQYLRKGWPANIRIPFEKAALKSNYKIDDGAIRKVRKKIEEELGQGRLTEHDFETYREHPLGAIPKDREERKKRKASQEFTSRQISDFSFIGEDGRSINEEMGTFAKLEFPQGERMHDVLRRARQNCIDRNLDPKGLRALKFDIKSAYRIFGIDQADWWALCFSFEGKKYTHKRWPFGLTSSVYGFLRFPLMIIEYLCNNTEFLELGAEAGMYVDDLVAVAHDSAIRKAGTIIKGLFERWAIPIQMTKWAAENTNGLDGLSKVTILGLAYDLEDFSVGIPDVRKSEIMDELKELERKRWTFKELESTLGILGWAATAIPQIKMFLTSGWTLKKKWNTGGRYRNHMTKRTKDDMAEIRGILKRWNGAQSILESRWTDGSKKGYNIDTNWIDPASDASGSIGWGAVCEHGYVMGTWTEEERTLPIHIKEGLALFALIATFAGKLKGKKIRLRCDNKALVVALSKGRAKDEKLAIVMRLIVDELARNGIGLRCWKAKNAKATADTQFIGTKENTLADLISRGEVGKFSTITNKFSNSINKQTLPPKAEEGWRNAVKEIRKNICIQQEQTHPRKQL